MAKKSGKKPIEQYEHKGKKRINNPPVGLVTSKTNMKTLERTVECISELTSELTQTS